MTRRNKLALAALLALSGCTSGPATNDGKSGPDKFDRIRDPVIGGDKKDELDFGGASWSEEKLYDGVPEEKIRHHDSDVTFGTSDGIDHVKVAEWVKARKDIVTWCMDRDPQRLDQAIAILDRLVRNVPDATAQRLYLARCLFARGSEFWDRADMTAANLTIEEERENVREVERWRVEHERFRAYCEKYQKGAIHHFGLYMERAPMDRTPIDMVWKAQFQRGRYREAGAWLEQQIEQMGDDHPKKKEYQQFREEIRRYLAEVELKGYGKEPKLRPGGQDR